MVEVCLGSTEGFGFDSMYFQLFCLAILITSNSNLTEIFELFRRNFVNFAIFSNLDYGREKNPKRKVKPWLSDSARVRIIAGRRSWNWS